MSIPLIPGGVYVFFGGLAELGLAVLCLVLLVASGLLFRRSKRYGAYLLSFAVLASVLLVALSLQAPSRVWPTVLAAYEQPELRADLSRKADLVSMWQGRGHLSLLGWLRVSAKWGYCHEVWSQAGCATAPGQREPEGIARERLQHSASQT